MRALPFALAKRQDRRSMRHFCTRILLALALLPAAACVFGGGGGGGGGGTPLPRSQTSFEEPERAPETETPATVAAALSPEYQPANVVSADTPLASRIVPARGTLPAVPETLLVAPDAASAEKEFEGEGLAFARGEGKSTVWVPKAEALEFDVLVDLPVFGKVTAGQVVLNARVEPYVAALLASKKPDAPREWMGSIESVATGSHLGYTLHEVLKSRLLPQDFPRTYYTDTQTGSENRRKELKLGLREGKYVDVFRNDGHCKGCGNREHFVDSNWLWGDPSHCDGCKRGEHRVWRQPETRDVPAGTLDMLSAVYLARTMVREARTEERLFMVDGLKLWDVELRQGVKRRIEVPAGKFDCVEMRLKSQVPPGEPPPKSGFAGLFGLKGTIQVWLDAKYGVPVQIQGEFPIKLISSNLDVYVVLKGYRGAPAGFAPAER
jgi:hypothetical protein